MRQPIVRRTDGEMEIAVTSEIFHIDAGHLRRVPLKIMLGELHVAHLELRIVEAECARQQPEDRGVGLGLAFAAYVPPVDGVAPMLLHRLIALPRWTSGVLDALLGAIFCGGLLWLTAWLYKVIRHRDGMGFGDVKMMFMVGTFLGLRGAFLTVLIGTFLGTIVGLSVIGFLFVSGWKKSLAERASKMGLGGVAAIRWAIASRYQLPLGSFLGIAALLVTFFSPWTLSRCAVLIFG